MQRKDNFFKFEKYSEDTEQTSEKRSVLDSTKNVKIKLSHVHQYFKSFIVKNVQ